MSVSIDAEVSLAGISKRFGAVQALDSVDLSVSARGIHAIVGENGAGKTTLMRILYGAEKPDSGTIQVAGVPQKLRSSADASRIGIGMVSQHYGIIPELTCLQNLILGSERSAILDGKSDRNKAEELASKMGFAFDWSALASTLSPAAQQKLEILKLLWRNSKIMILDEPTAMLSPSDAEAFFQSMGELVQEGTTVLLVTHRLPEVMLHSQRVTVMRGGKAVANLNVADTKPQELTNLIIGEGRTLVSKTDRVPNAGFSQASPALEMRSVSVLGERGHTAVKEASLSVRPGEIVGIAGVDGNGQRELTLAIAGIRSISGGFLGVLGSDGSSSTKARIRAGLRIIPEDRRQEAIIESWSLDENAALGLQFLEPLSTGRWIDLKARRAFAARAVERFKTRHGSLNQPISGLSGGNQQRFVAGRALSQEPKLLLAFQPARGLDLVGTADVYAEIRRLCDQGMAAVIVSFDLDELLTHCDRIVVMNGGRLEYPKSERALDRSEIGRLMVGA